MIVVLIIEEDDLFDPDLNDRFGAFIAGEERDIEDAAI